MATPIRSDLVSADVTVGNATKASEINNIRADMHTALTELDYGGSGDIPASPAVARIFLDQVPSGGGLSNKTVYAAFTGSTTMQGVAAEGYKVGGQVLISGITTSTVHAAVSNLLAVSKNSTDSPIHLYGYVGAHDFNIGATSGPALVALMALRANDSSLTGAASLGDSAALYIDNSIDTTGITQTGSNWAIWVDAGDCQFDGDVNVGTDINLSGAFRSTGNTSAHAFGTTAANNNQFTIGGTFTSGGVGTAARSVILNGTLVGANGDTTSLNTMQITANINTQDNSETIAQVGSLSVNVPNITKGATDDITDAYSLYIAGAPTEGDNNWSLWVDNGVSRFDGVASTTIVDIRVGSTKQWDFEGTGSNGRPFILAAFGNGSSVGRRIQIERNNNGGTPASGHLAMEDAGGSVQYVWPDDSAATGDFRIGTTAPNNANDTSGTVIGTQTSWHELKEDINLWFGEEAIDRLNDLKLYSYRFKGDGKRHGKLMNGLVVFEEDRGSWWSMNDASNQTPALDEANLIGHLIAAVQTLDERVKQLEA
jgi:hypothetical protein